MQPSAQKIWAIRLQPGEDLKQAIVHFARQNAIAAGYIISGIGSLNQCNIRLAGANGAQNTKAKFEILSLAGTLAVNGAHLHIALADAEGKVTGGHVLDGNLIYTTAEIIIGEAENLVFTRVADPQSGYQELIVKGREI
jgi:uncharacterized protein